MSKFGIRIKIQVRNGKNFILVFGIEFYDFWCCHKRSNLLNADWLRLFLRQKAFFLKIKRAILGIKRALLLDAY